MQATHNGRTMLIANAHAWNDKRCGAPIGVWFGQISPEFVIVFPDHYGYGLEDAIESAADESDNNGDGAPTFDPAELAREMLEDGDCETEEGAWEAATEGAYGLNGGAEWIDCDDWGVWPPTDEEIEACRLVAQAAEIVEESDRVCVDCARMIANGEAPEGATEAEAEELAEACAGWVLTGTEASGEPGFSMSACPCCGSSLGGDRFYATKLE